MTVTEVISPQSELVTTLTEFSLNFYIMFESLKVSLAVDIDRAFEEAITKQIDRLREEINKDIDDLSKRVAGVEKSQQDCAQKQDNIMKKQNDFEHSLKDYKQHNEREEKKSLLLVIKNLPEREGEDALGLVNSVIKDDIKLPDVSVTEVERKKSYREGYPGVVIATCASRDDKRQIMSNKSSLKDSTHYQRR